MDSGNEYSGSSLPPPGQMQFAHEVGVPHIAVVIVRMLHGIFGRAVAGGVHSADFHFVERGERIVKDHLHFCHSPQKREVGRAAAIVFAEVDINVPFI